MQYIFGDKNLIKLRGIILAVILITGALTIAVPSALPSAYAAQPIQVPSKVLNLLATTISGTQIMLTWDLPATDGGSAITGYQIERKDPNAGYQIIVVDTQTTDRVYVDSGLLPATTYHYKVFAINAVGVATAASNEGSATTATDGISPETTITSNPTNPTASTSATFEFTSSETPSTFECDLDGIGFVSCTTSYTYLGLTDGSHTFQVRATDASGNVDATPDSYTWTISIDTDGDGVPDVTDNCPLVPNADQLDTDGDGLGDACDPDDDNDTIPDVTDNCPLVPNTDQTDTDGDGIGDACESDTDGDGIPDVTDNCLLIVNPSQTDTDGDGLGDACDTDDDNDTILDGADNCQFVANTDQLDTDGDGIGDVCDGDMDGDSILNGDDNCPLVSNVDQADNDTDGLGDVCDTDDDNDTVLDGADNCQFTANTDQLDTDGDGIGDACDTDDDNDTILDGVDNCQFTANTDQTDTDGNGIGDACDGDIDGDGVLNDNDNCPTTPNTDQADNDSDGVGDVCDPDDDNDTILDGADNCQLVANTDQADNDSDGIGDACDTDDDNDTILDGVDNCQFTANTDQTDTDGNGIGDACDGDMDGDSILNGDDNCPLVSNVDQADNDLDGIGDACDTDDDNDTILDGADNCQLVANTDQADNDSDGIGDACDTDDDNDTILDGVDNCQFTANTDQLDTDGDGIGDACDSDNDNDTILDGADNCQFTANTDQLDTDGDGVGDVCDYTISLSGSALSQTIINLQWTAAPDNDSECSLERYDVYRDGVDIGDVTDLGDRTFSDTDLLGDTVYIYQVKAVYCEALTAVSNELEIQTRPFSNGALSWDITPPSVEGINFSSVQSGTPTEGFGGRLASYSNDIPTQVMNTGEEQRLQISVYDNNGIAAIKRVVVNMFFDYYETQKSDTYFMYIEGQGLTVSDPFGFFGDVKVHRTYTETEMILTFVFTPQKPMPITDIVINGEDEYRNNINTIIFGAMEIQGESVESVEESTMLSEIPYYKNPEWNQFVIDSDGNMVSYDSFGNLEIMSTHVIDESVYYGKYIGKSDRHDDSFNDKVAAEDAKARELVDARDSYKIFYEPEKIFKVDKVFNYPKNVGKADRGDVKSMNDLKQKEHTKALHIAKKIS